MTWVKKDEGWNWLEKQLVSLLPEARIWTFGYDSSWCGEFSVDTDLSEVSGKLLDAVVANVLTLISFQSLQQVKAYLYVQNLQNTRLVFIAHSFGGIVVVKVNKSFVHSRLITIANHVPPRTVAYHGRESR